MKNIYKIAINIALLSVFMVSSCVFNIGCTPNNTSSYLGKHIDFYTEAYNSLVTKGYYQSGCVYQVAIEPVETDSYGRTLFCYADTSAGIKTDYHAYETRNYALLICQFSTDNEVYYYQDYSFINKEAQPENEIDFMASNQTVIDPINNYSSIKNPLYGFDEEDIRKLKEWNDWDMPIDESKCVSTAFNDNFCSYYNSDYYETEEWSSVKDIESLYKDIIYISYNQRLSIISKDKFGNNLIRVCGRENKANDDSYKEVVFITSKTFKHLKYNFSVTLVDEYENLYLPLAPNYAYQEALKKLRADNYWNVCDLDEVIAQQTSAS
ncbi:MAG: hypothetical protein J5762_06165 [Clostridia bacterium]|nr:hypothetical protein [Clostridia bacterium]